MKDFTRLNKTRQRIIHTFPTFGYLIERCRFGFTKCETCFTDGKDIIYDYDFYTSLNDEELYFTMMHEFCHILFGHCIRMKGKNKHIYNIASDIVVNGFLSYYGIDIRVHGEPYYFMHKGRLGYEYKVEEIYDDLMNEDMNYIQGIKSFDDHSMWTTESLPEELQDIYIAGNDEVNAIRKYDNKKIDYDWESLLIEYFNEVFDEEDYSYSKIDTRFYDSEFLLPDLYECEENKVNNVWVLIDVSGSINKEQFSKSIALIRSLIHTNYCEGYVSFFDDRVSTPVPIHDNIELNIEGYGGTDFILPLRMMNLLLPQIPDLIIYITDGEGTFPKSSDIPIIWMIDNEKIKQPPVGKVVYIR